MDPNQMLKEIRSLIHEWKYFMDGEHREEYEVLEDLATRVDVLDTWLTRKGFLPEDWKR